MTLGIGDAILVMERSAEDAKVTLPVAELLVRLGSGVVEETEPVSSTSVPFKAVNDTIVIALGAPAGRLPRLQLSVVKVAGKRGIPVQPGAEIIVNGNVLVLRMVSVNTTPD